MKKFVKIGNKAFLPASIRDFKYCEECEIMHVTLYTPSGISCYKEAIKCDKENAERIFALLCV